MLGVPKHSCCKSLLMNQSGGYCRSQRRHSKTDFKNGSIGLVNCTTLSPSSVAVTFEGKALVGGPTSSFDTACDNSGKSPQIIPKSQPSYTAHSKYRQSWNQRNPLQQASIFSPHQHSSILSDFFQIFMKFKKELVWPPPSRSPRCMAGVMDTMTSPTATMDVYNDNFQVEARGQVISKRY